MNGTLYSHLPVLFTGGAGVGGSGVTLEHPAERAIGGVEHDESVPVGYGMRGLIPGGKTGRMGATGARGNVGTAAGQLSGLGVIAGAAAGTSSLLAPLRQGIVRSGSAAGSSTATLAAYAKGVLGAALSIGSRPSADDAAEAVLGKEIVGLGMSVAEVLSLVTRLLRNRQETDPATGKFRVYDDDDASVLVEADLWDDVGGTTPYSGEGADRRDRLT